LNAQLDENLTKTGQAQRKVVMDCYNLCSGACFPATCAVFALDQSRPKFRQLAGLATVFPLLVRGLFF
jgi:hypothetical protein